MELAKADSAEADEEVRNDGPCDREDGHQALDGEAHGVAFSGYVRENGEVKLWVKRRMRLKGGPQTMFGSDFANVELELTDE